MYEYMDTLIHWFTDARTHSKRHSHHAVELSQRFAKPCANCVPAMGADYHFLGKPAMRTRWMAGNALHKSGDVETNPGLATTPKQVWICDICHIQTQVRK